MSYVKLLKIRRIDFIQRAGVNFEPPVDMETMIVSSM